MRGDGALGESRTASNGQEQDLLDGLLGLQNAVAAPALNAPHEVLITLAHYPLCSPGEHSQSAGG